MKFCPLKIWHCTAPMLYLGTVTEIACAGATMVKVFLLFFLSKKFTRGRSMKNFTWAIHYKAGDAANRLRKLRAKTLINLIASCTIHRATTTGHIS